MSTAASIMGAIEKEVVNRSREAATEAANIFLAELSSHIKTGKSLAALEALNHPYSRANPDPGAAGLSEEWEVNEQTGKLKDSLKVDVKSTYRGYKIYVGPDPSLSITLGKKEKGVTMTMLEFMEKIIVGGTKTMVGRPLVNNSLHLAFDRMNDAFVSEGFRRMSVKNKPPMEGVS